MTSTIERKLSDQTLTRVLFSLAKGPRTPVQLCKSNRLGERNVRNKLRDLASMDLVRPEGRSSYTLNWGTLLRVFLDIATQETAKISSVDVSDIQPKRLKSGLEGIGHEWRETRAQLDADPAFRELVRRYFAYIWDFNLAPPDVYAGVTALSTFQAFEPFLVKFGPFLVSSAPGAKVLRRWYKQALNISSLEEMALYQAFGEMGVAKVPED